MNHFSQYAHINVTQDRFFNRMRNGLSINDTVLFVCSEEKFSAEKPCEIRGYVCKFESYVFIISYPNVKQIEELVNLGFHDELAAFNQFVIMLKKEIKTPFPKYIFPVYSSYKPIFPLEYIIDMENSPLSDYVRIKDYYSIGRIKKATENKTVKFGCSSAFTLHLLQSMRQDYNVFICHSPHLTYNMVDKVREISRCRIQFDEENLKFVLRQTINLSNEEITNNRTVIQQNLTNIYVEYLCKKKTASVTLYAQKVRLLLINLSHYMVPLSATNKVPPEIWEELLTPSNGATSNAFILSCLVCKHELEKIKQIIELKINGYHDMLYEIVLEIRKYYNASLKENITINKILNFDNYWYDENVKYIIDNC